MITVVQAHFVTFNSPGTFFSEERTLEIDSWDVAKAKAMAATIKERHRAVPYSFHFTTRERGPNDLDSHQTAKSGQYFLGGMVLDAEGVKRHLPGDNEILLSNMSANNWPRVVVNENSWRTVQPFLDGDCVI